MNAPDRTTPSCPLIYNLFPRLAGHVGQWAEHLERAAEMAFNWLYLNPPFYPGFSGSVYAVKEFGRLDPVLCPPGDPAAGLDALAPVLSRAKSLGLRPMVDLVINHTAKDCELVTTHPEWFYRDEQGEVQSPFAIDPADARRRTVWGDLAELDYAGTVDPEGLRQYVEEAMLACMDVGFEGFRCDAAYKVPAEVWARLTARARERLPSAMFVAETLGCRPEEMTALAGAGFDYVMNSSKYWAFDAPWCLEQHESWQQVAPSVAFPESHDTPRLAAETGGLERVQRQRFVLAAVFSRGLLLPVGFELGFTRAINVVETRRSDWERPAFDLRAFVKETLQLKLASPALSAEGHFRVVTSLDQPTLILEKRGGGDRALLLVNKDWHNAQQLELGWLMESWEPRSGGRLVRPCLDRFGGDAVPRSQPLRLEPAEIAVVFD